MAIRVWHAEDIKAELRKRFGPITRLSQSWGYHRAAISMTLNTTRRSRSVERRIAEALNVPLHELWPHRWAPQARAANRRALTGAHLSRAGAEEKRQNGSLA